MTLRWFKFDHHVPQVASKEKIDRGFLAVHLAASNVPEIKPWCGALARVVEGAREPGGFVIACAACLARSEARP